MRLPTETADRSYPFTRKRSNLGVCVWAEGCHHFQRIILLHILGSHYMLLETTMTQGMQYCSQNWKYSEWPKRKVYHHDLQEDYELL